MLTVVFFARLKEQLQCDKLELDWQSIINGQSNNDLSISIAQLMAVLIEKNPGWQKPLANPQILSAINHQVASQDGLVKDNDEVAFFPPVTGG